MRLLIFFILFSTFRFNTLGQVLQKNSFTPFTIDTTLNSKLAKAKLKSAFNSSSDTNGFWFLMVKEDYQEYVAKKNLFNFFDTLQIYADVLCDCMIKKDTIYLKGGIGYEGAIGFDLRIISGLFNGRILLKGKGYKTNESSEYVDEILFKSVRQTLKIQNRNSLKLGKKMIGELFMESEDYLEKGEENPNKIYMKVLFGCKLDKVTGL